LSSGYVDQWGNGLEFYFNDDVKHVCLRLCTGVECILMHADTGYDVVLLLVGVDIFMYYLMAINLDKTVLLKYDRRTSCFFIASCLCFCSCGLDLFHWIACLVCTHVPYSKLILGSMLSTGRMAKGPENSAV